MSNHLKSIFSRRDNYFSYKTSKYKLNHYETASGIKLILLTDLCAGHLRDFLHQLYENVSFFLAFYFHLITQLSLVSSSNQVRYFYGFGFWKTFLLMKCFTKASLVKHLLCKLRYSKNFQYVRCWMYVLNYRFWWRML